MLEAHFSSYKYSKAQWVNISREMVTGILTKDNTRPMEMLLMSEVISGQAAFNFDHFAKIAWSATSIFGQPGQKHFC